MRVELANGAYLTSMFGYGLSYNTLDNNKNPTSGMYVQLRSGFRRCRRRCVPICVRPSDLRTYYEVVTDLVSIVHLQAGDMIGLNKCPTRRMCVGRRLCAHA